MSLAASQYKGNKKWKRKDEEKTELQGWKRRRPFWTQELPNFFINRITPDQTDSMEISETPIPVQSPVLGNYWGDKGSIFFPISYLNKIRQKTQTLIQQLIRDAECLEGTWALALRWVLQLYCLMEVSCSKILRTWTDPFKIMLQVNTEEGIWTQVKSPCSSHSLVPRREKICLVGVGERLWEASWARGLQDGNLMTRTSVDIAGKGEHSLQKAQTPGTWRENNKQTGWTRNWPTSRGVRLEEDPR